MASEIVPKPGVLRIGAAAYDPATGALATPDGAPIRLRRQSAEVLAALAARPGETVTRADLVAHVWGDVATTDDSLIQCIGDIRRALGREAVETYPKVGYRLVARVADAQNSDLDPDPDPDVVAERPAHRRALAAAALVGLLAAGLGAWAALAPDRDATTQAVVPPTVVPGKTLAVLPFVNLGGGPETRFFGDGLSEDLTTDLARIPDLTVVAFASSDDFPQAEAGFPRIARDLGVRYLVRGTIRHSGERVRINAALIDPFEGVALWAERFDRVTQDPFDVQEDVTRAIVRALSLSLEVEAAPRPVETDAYFMLLRGLEPLRQDTLAGNRAARGFFEKALALSPGYARAHAYVAVTHGRDTMLDLSGAARDASVRAGLEAAVTAIRLEPRLPKAYFALAVLNLAIGEHDRALSAARHSVRLDRNFADGYAALAEIGMLGGDLEEALDAIRHAKRLNPHHPARYDWIEGAALFLAGDARAARPPLEAAVTAAPGFLPGVVLLAAALAEAGETDRARTTLGMLGGTAPWETAAAYLSAAPFGVEARRRHVARAVALLDP